MQYWGYVCLNELISYAQGAKQYTMGYLMNEQKIIHTHTLKCLCLVVHFDEPAWHKNIMPWSVGKYKLPMDWKWQLSRASGLYTVYIIKYALNTLRLRQDGRHFADIVLKCIFLNENVWISLKIPLKFVPRGPINNNPALVKIMACADQATSHYLNQCWYTWQTKIS